MKQKQTKNIDRFSSGETDSKTRTNDPIFKKYGEPFIVTENNKIVLNSRAIAVKCATVNRLKYNADDKSYERYDAGRGLWTTGLHPSRFN